MFAVVTAGKRWKWKMESRNLYVRTATGRKGKRLAYAICFKCNHDTRFDARFLDKGSKRNGMGLSV